jgi:hypothetical protein
VSLAHARGPEEHHVFGTLDEGEVRQFQDLLAGRADGEVEVVLIQRLDRREARDAREHLASSRPARLAFGGQQLLNEVVNKVLFSAAFCGSAVYCAATPPSRSSLHSSTSVAPLRHFGLVDGSP